MRIYFIIYFILSISCSYAQLPPALQWQKSYGGSLRDEADDMLLLPDGSLLVLGTSFSDDGDITGHHPSPLPHTGADVVVLKVSPSGNIIWQKAYGGSLYDKASSIISTIDGGFAFIGITSSVDGDVSDNHGNDDIWMVKCDASGNIQWQKTYGGSGMDWGCDVIEVSNGFVFIGLTNSSDGDVTGLHGISSDVWVVRTDVTGSIVWQRAYGGTGGESAATDLIRPTPDGNFVFVSNTSSIDGDVSSPELTPQDLWLVKITPTGSIIWDKRYGAEFGDIMHDIIVNLDGTILLAGRTYSKTLPGAFPGDGLASGWLIKTTIAGNIQWMKIVGGIEDEVLTSVVSTSDGGYLLAGATESNYDEVCKKYLLQDLWLTKVNASGNTVWSRTFGGNKEDYGTKVLLTPASEAWVLSTSTSSDGDLTLNRGETDLWLARFAFTGTPSFCSAVINSETDSISCSGQTVYFYATHNNCGPEPTYQWKLNGVATGTNNDTLYIRDLKSTDIITCELIDNSPCVDIRTPAVSNSISITVGNEVSAGNFLPSDTSLCIFQNIHLKANGNYNSYLWSNNSVSPSITVRGAGSYWLEVTDSLFCRKIDTVTITIKDCIEGVFMPTAFTPNNDGKNDVFKPIMNAVIDQYRFTVFDRWGRKVFETTNPESGWDGRINGKKYNTGVFIWHCTYRIAGYLPATERGTVLLL